jgi:hypothetical protein
VRPAPAAAALVATRTAAALLAALAASCGPYAEVAQKLDVTTPFADAETWIAAQGTETRLLVLGRPAGAAGGAFALTVLQTPVSAGISASALQGDWSGDGGAAATFTALREYLLPDERGTPLLSRIGATRRDVHRVARVGFSRDGERLTVSGDPALGGVYLPLPQAMAALGTATSRDASCAFQVANLAVRAAHVRVIGFGGPGMTQYQNPATYNGTLGGSFHVALEGFLDNRTTITFAGLVELGGVRLDGSQITNADSSGDGQMSGALAFVLEPRARDGAANPTIAGSLDYGGAGDPSDAVQIDSGSAVGGHYAISLAGGGTSRVSPETAPAPSVAECLSLP